MLILTTYITDDTCSPMTRSWALIALGLVGGIVFWVSWLIAFSSPVAIVLLAYGRAPLRRAGWAATLAFWRGPALLGTICNTTGDSASC